MVKKAKILVVDDQHLFQKTIETILRGMEIELVLASTGREAVDLISVNDFALIILDINMPIMDGFETIRQVRGLSTENSSVPIMLVTSGDSGEREEFKGYDMGIVDFMLKPLEPSILRSKVNVFATLYEQRKKIEQHTFLIDALLNTIPEPAYLLDKNYELLALNLAGAKTLNTSSDNLVGENYLDILPKEIRTDSTRALNNVMMSKQTMRYEDRILGKFMDISISPVGPPEGEVDMLSIFSSDITEFRNLEELLQVQRDLGFALSSAMNLKTALMLCLQAALRIESMDFGLIYTLNPEDDSFELSFDKGLEDEPDPIDKIVPGDEYYGFLTTQKPVYLTGENCVEAINDPKWHRISMISAVPVVFRGKVKACLICGSREQSALSEGAKGALEAIAAHMGSVLIRLKVQDDLAIEAALNRTIAELSNSILKAESLVEICENVLACSSRLTASHAGYVAIVNQDASGHPLPELEYIYKDGEFTELKGISLFPDLAIWLVDSKKPVLINDLKSTQKWDNEILLGDGVESFLAVPAFSGDSLSGIIAFSGNQSGYNGHDLSVVGQVASAFALGVSRKKAELELEKYKAVIEASSEAIAIKDFEDKIIFANHAYHDLFGVDSGQVIGNRANTVLCESSQRFFVDRVLPVVEQGASWEGMLEGKGKDGHCFPIWMRTDGVYGPEGDMHYGFDLMHDITAEKEAEQQLKRALQEKEDATSKLNTVFMSIPDAIVTVDNSMSIMDYNQSFTRLCAMAKGLESGTSVDVLKKCHCQQVLEQTIKDGQTISDYRVKCKYGINSNQVVILSSAPLSGNDGQHHGAVLVVRDITRLVDMEEKLSEKRGLGNIVGKSQKMLELYDLVEQLANVDSTVLITGESGTGKELVAEALHFSGARSASPLVKVNCSALSENILESELFGHVRGAFSGAVSERIGRFEAAQGGTILLDEIGDISPLIQLKLLRVIENKEFEKVGDSRTFKADVRIVAATNVDLKDKVSQGLFRADLYYRLMVMRMELPPLRERKGDIAVLTDHFISMFKAQMSKQVTGVDNEVMKMFMNYEWPGNIRELKNVLEHSYILCPGGLIRSEHLPKSYFPAMIRLLGTDKTETSSSQLIKEDVVRAMQDAGGKKAKAARALGISRPTLYRKLKDFGLN